MKILTLLAKRSFNVITLNTQYHLIQKMFNFTGICVDPYDILGQVVFKVVLYFDLEFYETKNWIQQLYITLDHFSINWPLTVWTKGVSLAIVWRSGRREIFDFDSYWKYWQWNWICYKSLITTKCAWFGFAIVDSNNTTTFADVHLEK